MLDGVVFSGGEPLMQAEVVPAVWEVYRMGYQVAVHTSGVYADRLKEVLPVLSWVGLDVKVMRTQKTGADMKHLDYSRKIFLKLLEISRSLDDSMIEQLTAERDYEELNYYILNAMLKG